VSKSYSYLPARYGTGNLGRISHQAASKYAIRFYSQDKKIAQRHYDQLKKARDTGTGPAKSQVPPIVPNPGNPLQFTPKSAENMGDPPIFSNGLATPQDPILINPGMANEARDMEDPLIDEAVFVHKKMAKFHNRRAQAFLEAARIHDEMRAARQDESSGKSSVVEIGGSDKMGSDDDDHTGPTSSPVRLPSLFDYNESGAHTADDGLEYHIRLHGDAILEAQHYRRVREDIQNKLENFGPAGLGIGDDEKVSRLKESLDVCNQLHELYTELADLHGQSAGDFDDYLKRRADRGYGYEPDNTIDDPPVHEPDPNPFNDPPPMVVSHGNEPL
jgi:hypothetical protein